VYYEEAVDVDIAAMAQAVSAHPVESIMALAGFGVMTLLGRTVQSRVQAVVNIAVLLVVIALHRARR
jgi:hypothetical protein